MNIEFSHQPIMPGEILSLFGDATGKTLIDATAGGGGHLELFAQAVGDSGRVYGFDKDPRAHREDAAGGVAARYRGTVKLFTSAFSQINRILKEEQIDEVDGLLCDLGVSSNQLDDSERGFSLKTDGPIDMRMDTTSPLTAYEWLKRSSEKEIADAIYNYGEERKSRAIARLIKQSWPIENSTLALSHVVLSAIRQRTWTKTHPATRTFQAIRMAVNDELGELKTLLDALPNILAVNGVAIFLSFHSIEDRLVKIAFKELSGKSSEHGDKTFKILTKKPLTPSKEELAGNRRSRSAKLRALVRIS